MMEEEEITANEEVSEPATDSEVKACLQELIKYGYLEEARKPALFKTAVVREVDLIRALEPLDLSLRLDTHRGLALLVIIESEEEEPGEAWSHPLVRRQRLTLEQSLLVAILREAFLLHEQERGVGQAVAKLAIEDLMPKFLTYLADSGSDTRNQSRLTSILDQLKTHGIVSEVDKNDEVTIRPLIVHLANAESLAELLKSYQAQAETNS
jgi:hypothetical protein